MSMPEELPHTHVSEVLHRAKAPHYMCLVSARAVGQPPPRCAETRLNTISLRRVIVDLYGE